MVNIHYLIFHAYCKPDIQHTGGKYFTGLHYVAQKNPFVYIYKKKTPLGFVQE